MKAPTSSGRFQKRKYDKIFDTNGNINNIDDDVLPQEKKIIITTLNLKRIPHETEVMFAQTAKSISSSAYQAALELIRNPDSITAANHLVRTLLSQDEIKGIDSNAIERCLPVLRWHTLYPQSLSSTLFAAHEASNRRKYVESVELYLKAFKMDPTQPLTLLLLSIFFLFFSQHTLVGNKSEVMVKAVAFFNHYRATRMSQTNGLISGTLNEKGYEVPGHNEYKQEVYYNFGRFCQEVGLNHLAVDNYNEVLKIADILKTQGINSQFSVTREAAFNLVIIYKKSNSLSFANDIMRKYLSF
jgi:tetratricopeptide (TPR) repeat protein